MDMDILVYTSIPTPFSFGGIRAFVSTRIREYERIDIGRGYFAILFKNKYANLWHIALESCGALIGSNKSKAKLIASVKKDTETGDKKVMEQQIRTALEQRDRAMYLEPDQWFQKFSKTK